MVPSEHVNDQRRPSSNTFEYARLPHGIRSLMFPPTTIISTSAVVSSVRSLKIPANEKVDLVLFLGLEQHDTTDVALEKQKTVLEWCRWVMS